MFIVVGWLDIGLLKGMERNRGPEAFAAKLTEVELHALMVVRVSFILGATEQLMAPEETDTTITPLTGSLKSVSILIVDCAMTRRVETETLSVICAIVNVMLLTSADYINCELV